MGGEKTAGFADVLIVRPEFRLGVGWDLPGSRERIRGQEMTLGVTVGQGIPLGNPPSEEGDPSVSLFLLDSNRERAVPYFVHGGYFGYSHRGIPQMTSYQDGIYRVMNHPVDSHIESLDLGYRVGFEGLPYTMSSGIQAGAGLRGSLRHGDDTAIGGAVYVGAYIGPFGMMQVGYEHEWGRIGYDYEADLVTVGGAFPMRVYSND